MKTLYNLFFRSIESVICVNNTAEKALVRLGINNFRDLIFYKPISYNFINIEPDLRTVKYGDLVQVEVMLEDVLMPVSNKSPFKMLVSNNTGFIILVFFNQIHPFIYSQLRIGQKYIISGKIDIFDRHLQISHPDFSFNKKYSAPIIPIYPLTYGIVNKQLYGYICEAINLLSSEENWNINCDLSLKKYLTELFDEVKALHFINITKASINSQSIAIQKLAAKELFANQALLAKVRQKEHRPRGRVFSSDNDMQQQILTKLGFQLTPGQKEVIADIKHDQCSNMQMIRLLQGDVGSGKTLVALLTMLNVVKSGAQSVLMVPTDLLSIQHYKFFCNTLENTDIKIGLLTGKIPLKQRNQLKEELLAGKINILIGTHALFQENVKFQDLGYIVIDEQHRFGVEQRLELINKSSNPDILVMTATPIPRSLTLTVFGDMDVSQLKTKPSNRLPIITTIVSNEKRAEVIELLNKKLQIGEKIYWVCPLIEQNDNIDDKINMSNNDINDPDCSSVVTRFDELNQIYPNQVAMLHGKIKADIKDRIMQDFKDGRTKILVSTTVIEVGIDVPDSSLIIIENAEKFGLAQLHQLRGRVGRSNKQSYCMLMYNPKRCSEIARERLKIMRSSNDGFYIAKQDLMLRGGGEILGTKQSGEPEFFFADLKKDFKLLLKAHKLTKDIIHDDFTDFKISLFAKNKKEIIKSG